MVVENFIIALLILSVICLNFVSDAKPKFLRDLLTRLISTWKAPSLKNPEFKKAWKKERTLWFLRTAVIPSWLILSLRFVNPMLSETPPDEWWIDFVLVFTCFYMLFFGASSSLKKLGGKFQKWEAAIASRADRDISLEMG